MSEGTNSPLLPIAGGIVAGIAVVVLIIAVVTGATLPTGTCDALGQGTEWTGSNRAEEAARTAGLVVKLVCGAANVLLR